ncbi:unnamed protein product, partial [Musa acuminata subsp. burmannicoides]
MGNATGGLRGGANLASWVVAGTLTDFLWVVAGLSKIFTLLVLQERAALAAASDPHRYVERRKPSGNWSDI